LAVKQFDKEALSIEHEYLQKGNFDAMADKLLELGIYNMLAAKHPNEARGILIRPMLSTLIFSLINFPN
jgi:hypothetical protein